jgi:hypothetical protein
MASSHARIGVSDHAVARFIERWRPNATHLEARAELERLAAGASPTRRLTKKRDARIYTSGTAAGESIPLAVRDDTVVTVLPARRLEGPAEPPAPLSTDLLEEHAQDVGEAQAMAQATEDDERAAREVEGVIRSRRLNAQKVLDEWNAGAGHRRDVIERACRVLGVEVPERSAAGVLRITGGRYDGLELTLRPEETLNTVVGKLLAAMRSR